jgi:hypothetical protein
MSTAPKKDKPSTAAKTYVGVKGWLAVLTVVMGLGLVMNVVGLFQNLDSLKDPASAVAFELYPDLRDVLYFEILILVVAIAAAAAGIIMIFKRKRLAKHIIAGLLVGVVITGILDTTWISSILADNPEALESLDNDSEMARATVAALVWVPYLYVSKRVKQTLVR